ncbi:MAG: hypothetical protein IKN15_10205 [Bacteroidaceae bacterium]|nr:hypothetical protein [Bacteroidaceae bacterium]
MKLKEYLTTLIRKYNISFGYFMEMPYLCFGEGYNMEKAKKQGLKAKNTGITKK